MVYEFEMEQRVRSLATCANDAGMLCPEAMGLPTTEARAEAVVKCAISGGKGLCKGQVMFSEGGRL